MMPPLQDVVAQSITGPEIEGKAFDETVFREVVPT
jgi:hypothetical protein